MGKDCVDNAHPADWIREMNKMEHEEFEPLRDTRFELTGWPYVVDPGDKPYKRQESGSHYLKYPIQPTEYIIKNGLNFCEGNVVKYVTRWKDKGGVDDLKKARHYLDMMIEEHSNGV